MTSPFRIRHLDATSSTNDDVKKGAEAGEAVGYVVHALSQTAGRGRHGRQWQSPEGNLYCSVLLRPPQTLFGHYSFVASLALFDTVQSFLPDAAVTLKWPNDVLANGKKISGILLEAVSDGLVVGMGLNIAHHPEDALYPSTSLHASGAGDPTVSAVLAILLENLWRWHKTIEISGFLPIRNAWLLHAQKGKLTVRGEGGAVEGRFLTIDDIGHLRLSLEDGSEKSFATGDVFFGH